MRGFVSAIEQTNRVLALSGGALILFMFSIVTYEVFMRYVLFRPTMWVVDAAELMLVPIAFLPAAFILREGGHVRIDVVIKWLPRRLQAILDIVCSSLGLLFAFLILWRGAVTFLTYYQLGSGTQTAGLPLYVGFFFIPLGGLFLVLQYIIIIGRQMTTPRGGSATFSHHSGKA